MKHKEWKLGYEVLIEKADGTLGPLVESKILKENQRRIGYLHQPENTFVVYSTYASAEKLMEKTRRSFGDLFPGEKPVIYRCRYIPAPALDSENFKVVLDGLRASESVLMWRADS